MSNAPHSEVHPYLKDGLEYVTLHGKEKTVAKAIEDGELLKKGDRYFSSAGPADEPKNGTSVCTSVTVLNGQVIKTIHTVQNN